MAHTNRAAAFIGDGSDVVALLNQHPHLRLPYRKPSDETEAVRANLRELRLAADHSETVG